jgi:hypothetical protein
LSVKKRKQARLTKNAKEISYDIFFIDAILAFLAAVIVLFVNIFVLRRKPGTVEFAFFIRACTVFTVMGGCFYPYPYSLGESHRTRVDEL